MPSGIARITNHLSAILAGSQIDYLRLSRITAGLRRLRQISGSALAVVVGRQGSAQMVVRLMSLPSSMRWPGTS
jgi:hypothetical protein